MPKGPRGEKRPGDVIGAAIMVARIATGEVEESLQGPRKRTSGSGRSGGAARAAKLTPEKRSEIARQAARSRWAKSAGE
jgi:hypothetical protein